MVSPAERKLADLEAVFGALAHEQRRHILLTLKFRGGEMTAGDIASRFACSWPTTTGHLQALEKAGLLVSEKRGRERLYRLDAERLLEITGDWLAWFAPDRDAFVATLGDRAGSSKNLAQSGGPRPKPRPTLSGHEARRGPRATRRADPPARPERG